MREDDLRRILLVKAIEESDRDAAIIPVADREAGSREAMRATPSRDADALLAERSRTLFARIAARYPFVESVVALLRPSLPASLGVLAVALVLGASLSALDGSRRINVLAFPLLGLVAWNFAVYAFLLYRAARPAGAPGPLLAWVSSIGSRIAARHIAGARHFNVPLAGALQAFAHEWYESAKPLLLARASVLFHLGAAAIGVGLIAGLYLRGIAFDYRAGWESTFLDAPSARAILAMVYGPASALTGIPVPDAAQLDATRWRGASGGESAARWIHLIAASALVYVVLPRLALALAAAVRVLHLSRHATPPASLAPYFRAAFASVEGAVAKSSAIIVPYACELSPGALARLIAWLPEATGGPLTIDARASVPYGEEDRYLASLAEEGCDAAQIIVLPFSLATTPEDENHGKVIAGTRDRLASSRPQGQLLVVIDEAPYAQSMAGAPERVAERREVWRRFIEARGLKPAFVSLAA
jgi:hypothetical protein